MDKHKPLSGRRLVPLLIAMALAGCASAPQQPRKAAPAPKKPAPAPVAKAPAPKPLVLRPDHPQRYVVRKGDTLWDISAHFLRDPWRWPELWYNNPQIHNPHLIYPGDVLTLTYIGGRPVLRVQRAHPTVKLEPSVRVEPIETAIPTIPLDVIGPFLSQPLVVSHQALENAPYIVSSEGQHLIAGTDNRVYVRGLHGTSAKDFVVVRPGRALRNPDDHSDILGYQAVKVADAHLLHGGDPATLRIVRARREVVDGDKLLHVADHRFANHFTPRAPAGPVQGRILDSESGVYNIGQYSVVAINLGKAQKMRPGDVLAVYHTGETVRAPEHSGEKVKLPDERVGLVMVFRVFDRVSYALVMNATREIHPLDRVVNPDMGG